MLPWGSHIYLAPGGCRVGRKPSFFLVHFGGGDWLQQDVSIHQVHFPQSLTNHKLGSIRLKTGFPLPGVLSYFMRDLQLR